MEDTELVESTFLESLESVIRERLDTTPESSYTAKLAHQGIAKVAQKLGEEAIELALASVIESDLRVTEESADLLYHLLLMLNLRGIPLADVMAELEQRHKDRMAASD
jgi:phosphoribosyl-ATP pyrophosphohydrolase